MFLFQNPLIAMEKCLLWGHLAPITPSILTYKQSQQSDTETNTSMDPLVLLTMPDIFIAGNQPRYQAEFSTKISLGVVRGIATPALLCHKEPARSKQRPVKSLRSKAPSREGALDARAGSLWYKRAGASNTMKLSTNESRASTFLDQ